MEATLFTLLPAARPRWKSFATGWGLQALLLACLVYAGTRVQQNSIPVENYRATRVVPYEPIVLREQPIPQHPLVRTKAVATPLPTVETKRSPENNPEITALVVTPQVRATGHKRLEPEPVAPALKLDSKMPMIPSAPTSQIVAVGTFSHDSALTAPVAKPATAVHAGGFGDAGGNGPVHGRGMAAAGVAMSSGFSNPVVATAPRKIPAEFQPASAGANTPVEITFEPKPDYTDAGRKLKINGEVRLQVRFSADGRIYVIRVLQGLGYGLDEQAVKAAEQIKFKPALHEGQPVDSVAQVHIIFELIS